MSTLQPFVSVIIPTYNRSEFVCRAVASVLAQTYKQLECIVINDRSTDDTLNALAEIMQKDRRLIVVSHLENRHVSAARNTGLALAQGDLIAFLDDDDVWLPNKLQRQVGFLTAAPPEVGLVYCWMDIFHGEQVIGTRRPTLRGDIFDQMIESQPLGNASTLLVKHEVVRQIGGFDESLPRGNDGDFIRRIALHYLIEVVPEVLVHYFIDHGGNPRITDTSYASVMNGIRGHEAKLVKFRSELQSRRGPYSGLLAIIAQQYALVGDLQTAWKYLSRAFRISPASSAVWFAVPRILINYSLRRVRPKKEDCIESETLNRS